MINRVTMAALLFAAPALAFAEPAYSVKDIEKHFIQACEDGEDCLAKKTTRAVCIGAASNCEQKAAAPKDPGSFDMLITFQLGSDRLSATARQNLAEFAKALNGPALKEAQFHIDGHTDASGSEGYNVSLSNRRAASVVAFLESLGVARERLAPAGFGESKPRVSDPFAAINRRVEARLRLN